MFFRRRTPPEQEGPQRGRGGGRVRAKPTRKGLRRRRMGAGEALFLGLLTGIVVVVFEHYFAHLAWVPSLLVGVAITISSTAFNIWMENRRRRKDPEPRRPRRR